MHYDQLTVPVPAVKEVTLYKPSVVVVLVKPAPTDIVPPKVGYLTITIPEPPVPPSPVLGWLAAPPPPPPRFTVPLEASAPFVPLAPAPPPPEPPEPAEPFPPSLEAPPPPPPAYATDEPVIVKALPVPPLPPLFPLALEPAAPAPPPPPAP